MNAVSWHWDCAKAGQSEPKDGDDTDKASIIGRGQMRMVT